MNAKVLSILLCREYSIQLLESQKHRQFQLTVSHKHLTIRLFNQIKLKGFDESPQMNVFRMLNDIFAMLKASSSYHRAPTEERMVIFTPQSLPGLYAQTAWIIISGLIKSKKPIAWKNSMHFTISCYSSESHFR